MELTAEELIRDLGLDPVKNAETRFFNKNNVFNKNGHCARPAAALTITVV